jgi:hypothetical protein
LGRFTISRIGGVVDRRGPARTHKDGGLPSP